VCLLLLSLSGCNKSSDAGSAASTSIGTDVDDTVVTSRVKTALLNDAEVKSLDIMVETRKGEVMLSGFTENQMQIERGVQVARGVAGVKSVENKLSVKNAGQTMGSKIDDSVITMGVKSALMNDAAMKSMDVAVVTSKGEVQLSGFVDNATQVGRAASLAQAVAGVTSVVNHLEVKK
jgi:hyperosmotically inducible protein